MHAGAISELYQRARELRNWATYAEDVLWGFLKTKPLGYKFRRQHPYSIFILDFYCHKLKFVIEVDGSIHNRKEQQISDKERQRLLEQDGLEVIRFKNSEILTAMDRVTDKIISLLINKNENNP